MPRRRERLSPTALGAIVVVIGILLFFALLLAGVGRRMMTPRVEVRSDFATASGLREGNPVRLAGVNVGTVSEIEFAHVEYACDPLTEDFGRYGDGRTDNCDTDLFCTPQSLCGDLEPWAGKGEHTPCSTTESCEPDEICITSGFRGLFPHVDWSGPIGVCARFQTRLWRASVHMDIEQRALPLLRTDSRAMIASASALGNLLVDLSTGHAERLGPTLRIQSRPSLSQQIDRLRERVERFTAQADDAVVSIAHLIEELRDEATIDALGGIFFNLERISRSLAQGNGVLGALLSAPRLRADIGAFVVALRGTTETLESTMGSVERIGHTVGKEAGPVIRDADRALQATDVLLVDLLDPDNRSVAAAILRDPQLVAHISGIASNVEAIVRSGAGITRAIETGQGTLGKLINDPLVRIQLGHFLSTFAQRDVLRFFLRIVLERNDYPASEVRSPAGPPR